VFEEEWIYRSIIIGLGVRSRVELVFDAERILQSGTDNDHLPACLCDLRQLNLIQVDLVISKTLQAEDRHWTTYPHTRSYRVSPHRLRKREHLWRREKLRKKNRCRVHNGERRLTAPTEGVCLHRNV
jgi:hypothetical protein